MKIGLQNTPVKTSDGRSYKRSYRIWQLMRDRCYNKNCPMAKHYLGKGIKVCARWQEPYGKGYDNFIADMGEPNPNQSLDRIDSTGDYCPENCRWATHWQQMNNTTRHSNTGVRGVSFDKSRGSFNATFQNKEIGVKKAKRFDTLKEAVEWRKKMEAQYV